MKDYFVIILGHPINFVHVGKFDLPRSYIKLQILAGKLSIRIKILYIYSLIRVRPIDVCRIVYLVCVTGLRTPDPRGRILRRPNSCHFYKCSTFNDKSDHYILYRHRYPDAYSQFCREK